MTESSKRVLLLSYSYTGQTRRVLDAAGQAFAAAGWQVRHAQIEFTDPRFAHRFTRFPMRRVWPDMLSVFPAQTRRATGQIRIPDEVLDGDYDLICVGSPTWWRTVSMPVRSFLVAPQAHQLLDGKPFAAFVVCRRYWKENLAGVRKLGQRQGGRYLDGIAFDYPGGQLRSMLSLTSYLGSGQYRDRYLGMAIPATNISAAQLDQARDFAAGLAERVGQPA